MGQDEDTGGIRWGKGACIRYGVVGGKKTCVGGFKKVCVGYALLAQESADSEETEIEEAAEKKDIEGVESQVEEQDEEEARDEEAGCISWGRGGCIRYGLVGRKRTC